MDSRLDKQAQPAQTLAEEPWIRINNTTQRLRVPGGWIYRIFGSNGTHPAAVFVPLEAADYCGES